MKKNGEGRWNAYVGIKKKGGIEEGASRASRASRASGKNLSFQTIEQNTRNSNAPQKESSRGASGSPARAGHHFLVD